MPRDEHSTFIVRLREATERFIVALGTGLLRSDAGDHFIRQLSLDRSQLAGFSRQLRLELLQITAWMIGERRGAVPRGSSSAIAAYRNCYSVEQLCGSKCNELDSAQATPWQRLQRILLALWNTDAEIGIAAWGSDLFDPAHTSEIRERNLGANETRDLLKIVACELLDPCLSEADADVQLLGYIHEWLLERELVLHPEARCFSLNACEGHERRTTGSYFTPTPIVQNLLDACLEPALDEFLAQGPAHAAASRLLQLRIVDPACGTGVFLLAAARRIARRADSVSQVSTASACGTTPERLRAVIGQCLYGVDIGSLATSLCRLNLWFECGKPFHPIDALNQHIRCGNSTFGAWPGFEVGGVLDTAFEYSPDDEPSCARNLRRRNKGERIQSLQSEVLASIVREPELSPEHRQFLADLWCATFMWPKKVGVDVPTQSDFEWARRAPELALVRWRTPLRAIADKYQFFHWHLQFPDVFGKDVESEPPTSQRSSGFDFVIGNPPWVAHAGRSTQPLHAGLKRYFCATYDSFAGFPTTHGVFVELATRLLNADGRIAFVLPASVADLAGYAPTRKAHDRRCALIGPLPDYGEGRFAGVTQPCIALVSRRTATGRGASQTVGGTPWEIERSDLDGGGLELLNRMSQCGTFPAELFGERGFQSTPALRKFILRQEQAEDPYCVPLREGTDVREYHLAQARYYADACLLQKGLRPLHEFKSVAIVVRQTARYPIAAKSDGLAFRNSLLAVMSHPQWHWSAMLCILNSALIRWTHYYRFRDGRQPILPQLKVGHLRAVPAPPDRAMPEFGYLEKLGAELAERNRGVLDRERASIDEWVGKLYGISETECRMVTDWHGARPH
jgi:hypothetical protein